LTILVNINSNNEWVASNVDDGHLDYYFFLLASLMLAAELGFIYLSAGYQYVDPDELAAVSGPPAEPNVDQDSKRVISIDSTSGGGVVGLIGDVIATQGPAGERSNSRSISAEKGATGEDESRVPLLGGK
jgi:hypothetical protein